MRSCTPEVGLPDPLRSPLGRPLRLAGGIVAHNDERRIEASIRSLLGQELPDGVEWGHIWVVASGCTDRTAEVAAALAALEPRVRLVVEPERRGKAAALREVLRRAEGDLLVLLNSDAEASPGAVAAMLGRTAGRSRPFAVMARPFVPSELQGGWVDTMRWMWELHHEIHLEILADGSGAHLSDELLLVSLPAFPDLEEGIINDGSYFAVWLSQNGGGNWYAPAAGVSLDVPTTVRDHLRQRRRIHVGNAQVTKRLGTPPTTLGRFLLKEPRRALGTLRRMIGRESGLRHFGKVLAFELVSQALALWDRCPPRRDHVRWRRIEPAPETTRPSAPAAAGSGTAPLPEVDRRVVSVLSVARQFGTGLPLERLVELLPPGGPEDASGLERWLKDRPHLADVTRGRAFSPGDASSVDPTRAQRGTDYLEEARHLMAGPLAFTRRWVRCVGITGSAAYGEPTADDDLDFFVVTRAGAVWWFLATTWVALRLRRGRGRSRRGPTPCFNFVVDDARIATDLSDGSGLLFAREALSAQIVEGDSYYRGLLARAPWMARELPRLYHLRTRSPGETDSSPAPGLVRALSALVYPIVAAYLHLVGLRRNDHARREGHPGEVFRTAAAPDRLAFVSQRFEDLRARYEGRAGAGWSADGVGSPSRLPTAR
ncbi:MAG TPA: glycosyltransferase [Thermoplasmata archaeon]|nr:glycosyltransferase [Thermoplasmata archaeon]